MKTRACLIVVFALGLLSGVPTPAMAADCTFELGFATIKGLIPSVVGDCLEDVRYNPENGDALQQTTGGLLVWRKRDNFTAFTDGARSWVNGPYNLKTRLNEERYPWEGGSSGFPRPAGCISAVSASVAYPSRGGGAQTIFARALDRYGSGVSSAAGQFIVHYRTVTRVFAIGPTNGAGNASASWNVGGPVGYVPIDVRLDREGCGASGSTGFQGR